MGIRSQAIVRDLNVWYNQKNDRYIGIYRIEFEDRIFLYSILQKDTEILDFTKLEKVYTLNISKEFDDFHDAIDYINERIYTSDFDKLGW